MVLVGTFFLYPSLEDPDYVPVGLNLSSIALGALLFYGVNARSLFALDLWQVLSATYNAFGTGFTIFILVGERGGPEWRVAADLACYVLGIYFMAVGFLFKYEFTSTSVPPPPPPPPPPPQPQEPTPHTPLLTPPNPQIQRVLPPTPPPSLQAVAPLAPAPEENLSGQEDPLLPINGCTGDAGEGGGNLNQSGQHVYESVYQVFVPAAAAEVTAAAAATVGPAPAAAAAAAVGDLEERQQLQASSDSLDTRSSKKSKKKQPATMYLHYHSFSRQGTGGSSSSASNL